MYRFILLDSSKNETRWRLVCIKTITQMYTHNGLLVFILVTIVSCSYAGLVLWDSPRPVTECSKLQDLVRSGDLLSIRRYDMNGIDRYTYNTCAVQPAVILGNLDTLKYLLTLDQFDRVFLPELLRVAYMFSYRGVLPKREIVEYLHNYPLTK